jgi:hypothetical protein
MIYRRRCGRSPDRATGLTEGLPIPRRPSVGRFGALHPFAFAGGATVFQWMVRRVMVVTLALGAVLVARSGLQTGGRAAGADGAYVSVDEDCEAIILSLRSSEPPLKAVVIPLRDARKTLPSGINLGREPETPSRVLKAIDRLNGYGLAAFPSLTRQFRKGVRNRFVNGS